MVANHRYTLSSPFPLLDTRIVDTGPTEFYLYQGTRKLVDTSSWGDLGTKKWKVRTGKSARISLSIQILSFNETTTQEEMKHDGQVIKVTIGHPEVELLRYLLFLHESS